MWKHPSLSKFKRHPFSSQLPKQNMNLLFHIAVKIHPVGMWQDRFFSVSKGTMACDKNSNMAAACSHVRSINGWCLECFYVTGHKESGATLRTLVVIGWWTCSSPSPMSNGRVILGGWLQQNFEVVKYSGPLTVVNEVVTPRNWVLYNTSYPFIWPFFGGYKVITPCTINS